MRITGVQLKHLPVRTESGQTLGRIRDVVMQVEDHSIVQYTVGMPWFAVKTYLVHTDQVVKITDKEVIVRDAVIYGKAAEKTDIRAGAEPVAMREAD